MSKKIDVNGDFKQFIVFKIGQQNFGIDVLESREIILAEEITIVPDAPDFVEGIIDLRGEMVPIIDLARRLNLKKESSNNLNKVIIISLNEENLLGIKVDEVDEIVRIASKEIANTPEITKNVDRDYILGVAKSNDGLLVLLNFDQVFSIEVVEELSEINVYPL